MDFELYNYYDQRTVNNVPFLNSKEFKYITNKWGKVECRETLAEYIASNQSTFPFNVINKRAMVKNFLKLNTTRYEKYLTPSSPEVDSNILEKYDDYKYDYHSNALGMVDCPSAPFNRVSDYFMRKLRWSCPSYGHKSPIEVWENGEAKEIWGVLGVLWRGVNGTHFNDDGECTAGDLSSNSYAVAFRLGSYIATQFKPIVAKSVYEMTDAKRVLDTSMGWGDRLAGFFASSATEYIGCDPNPNTFKIYKTMAVEYSNILSNDHTITADIEDYFELVGDKKSIKIYRCGAENLPWDSISDIDCAFTSPPYFSTERYNEGGDKESDQSWSKFNEYNNWRDDFYLPVAKHSFESLSDKGFLIVNIMDPKIKGVRYYSCDELVDSLKDKFIGQFGMRIMQRPQGRHLYSTPEELKEYLNKSYIENVWCFSKSDEPIDLFRESRVATLDSFF